MKIGLQLWSVKEECEKDFIGTLKRIAHMGYDGVEFAGYGNLSSFQLKKVLKEFNLSPCGSHVPLSDLRDNLDEVIKFNLDIGNKYIICPYASFNDENDIKEVSDVLNKASDICSKNGLVLGYHNHNHEFNKFNEKSVLDLLFEKFNKEIISELDTYWSEYAGINAVSYMEEHRDRVKLIHIKDMIVANKEKNSTEIGNGILDIESIVKKAKENNLEWIIVEQEFFTKSPLESVKEGLEYLKTIV